MTDEVFCELLSCFSCSDAQIKETARTCLRAHSYLSPNMYISGFDMLDVTVTSLCASEDPQWGHINDLMLFMSTALTLNTEKLEPALAFKLINLSKIITETVMKAPKTQLLYLPDLYDYASAIIHCFDCEYFALDIDIVLALADHAAVGFLQRSTLIPIVMDRFQEVADIVSDCGDRNVYERLTNPFGSVDDDAVVFFLSLWAAMVKQVLESPIAIHALSTKFHLLMDLAAAPGQKQAAAALLSRCIAATEDDKSDLIERGGNVVNHVFGFIRRRRPSELRTVAVAKPEVKSQQHTIKTGKAAVEVMDNKSKRGKKKEWSAVTLFLLEEAKLLCWSKGDVVFKNGEALTFSDLTAIESDAKKEAERDNVIKLITKKGDFFIAFKNYPELVQWTNMLSQMMKVYNK